MRKHGVAKVIPSDDDLARAYVFEYRRAQAEQHIRDLDLSDVPIPDDLRERVEASLKDDASAWDDIIWSISSEAVFEGDKDE